MPYHRYQKKKRNPGPRIKNFREIIETQSFKNKDSSGIIELTSDLQINLLSPSQENS